MLSRKSSDASARLRRAKSTSSVSRKPVPKPSLIDTGSVAQQQAIAAAHRAFDKAKEIARAEQSLQRLQRTQSARPLPTRKSRRSGEGRLSGEGSHLSRRNSTIRVGGSESEAKKAPIVQKSTPQLRHIAPQKAPDSSPASEALSVTSTERNFAERFDGYGIPSNAQGQRPVMGKRSTTEIAQAVRETGIPPSQNRKRGITVTVPIGRENQTDENIIAMARDKYLREQMTPLKRRSSFLMPFRSLTRKVKKEPMLADETLSDKQSIEVYRPEMHPLEHVPPNPVRKAPPPPDMQETPTDTAKGRRISGTLGSLKRGWRRTFGRSPSGPHADFPVQNTVSQALYRSRDRGIASDFGFSTRDSTEIFPDLPGVPPPPPPHLIDVRRPVSNQGYDSVHEQDDTHTLRSRISSWNDSTRQNTIVMHDPSLLSIIQESPDKRKGGPYFSENIESDIQDEPKSDGSASIHPSSSNFNLRSSLDGRRLVSALMKHKRERSGDDKPTRKSSLSSLLRKSSEAGRPRITRLAAEPTYQMSASIRDVSAELPFGYFAQEVLPADSRQAPFDRSQLISPSVYSERPAINDETPPGSSSIHIPSTPPGVATVLQSEAVSKWSLDGKQKHKHSTSNEWRMWAADEFAGLDGRASFSIPDFSRSPVSPDSETRVETEQRRSMEVESFATMAHRSVPGTRQRSISVVKSSQRKASTPDMDGESLQNDSSSPMPAVPSKLSMIPIPKRKSSLNVIQPSNSQSQILNRYQMDESPVETLIKREPSNLDLLSKLREQGQRMINPKDTVGGIKSQEASIHDASSEPSPHSDADSPAPRRRRQRLDDNFLLRIRRGPYGVSASSLAKTPTGSADSISLPKRPIGQVVAAGKENTPPSRGQKMANDFLSSRSNANIRTVGQNSPAFL